MPFKFPWPFGKPRRQRPTPGASSAPASLPPTREAQASGPAAPDAAEPVQLSRAELVQSPIEASRIVPAIAPAIDIAPEAEGLDLGLELLRRQPVFSTPPTLGPLGGLPAMAQTLPTVERFMQTLPAPPPEPLLAGLGQAGDFAANLPSLAGFAAAGAMGQPPAFPAQLEPPSEPTDVLAPAGGLPGQIAGLSGAAPVLKPERQPPLQPQVIQPQAAPAGPSVAPAAPVQTAGSPSERSSAGSSAVIAPAPRAPESASATPGSSPASAPATPAVIQPGWPPAWSPATGPMTQVLPLAQTLTGNVLPSAAAEPVQREIFRRAEEEWTAPADLVQPPESAPEPGSERVSPAQREAIENQRGQGQPLAPVTRQRFEQAYGQPLDDVRVHTGPTAHAAAQSLNAIAFASGPDLFFTQNTYAPDSAQGLSLLGHELAHVIQQQYGVSGDADALRPADDRYERQADQLAARALETPMAEPPAAGQPASRGAAVQRAADDELRRPGSALSSSATPSSPAAPSQLATPGPLAPLAAPMVPAPAGLSAASAFTPGEQLGAAARVSPQTLASGPLTPGQRPEDDEPVQRFMAGQVSSVASPIGMVPSGPVPSLANAPQRLGSLTEQLLSPSVMLSNRPSLSRNLPGLGVVSEAGQGLPVFRSIRHGLPGLGSLPNLGQPSLPDASAVTNQLPSLDDSGPMGGGSPSMPDLGSVAQSLGQAMPPLPSLPGELSSLGGLKPPAMPLAEGLGALGQAASDSAGAAAGGAMAAGQPALGTITAMDPGGADAAAAAPATPPLPSLDKLTEHVWKEVQRKLKVERERSRGLA